MFESLKWEFDMLDGQNGIPPVAHLHFERGDLIIKEGDYGLSIYKILKGQVNILQKSGDTEMVLATLGPGEIFGEMAFLTRLLEPRSASARAVKDTEIEVWHPARLSQEYDRMPPIIKYIINQTLTRLKRMNLLMADLALVKPKGKGETQQREPNGSRREYYRKNLDVECTYRPVGSPPEVRLISRIINISRDGASMVVNAKDSSSFLHSRGDEFELSFTLPNGQQIDAMGKIKWFRHDPILRQIRLGLGFTELKAGAGKSLGFFLMG